MYCQLRTPVSQNQLSGPLGLSTQMSVCHFKPSVSKPQWDITPEPLLSVSLVFQCNSNLAVAWAVHEMSTKPASSAFKPSL